MKNVLNQIYGTLKPIIKGGSAIIKGVLDILFLIALAYGLCYVPALANYKLYVVQDSENELSYGKGTILYYQNVSAREIKEDDIILYRPGNDYIVHRVNRVVKEKKSEQVESNNTIPVDNESQGDSEAPIDRPDPMNGDVTDPLYGEDEANLVYYYETDADSFYTGSPNRIEYKNILGKVSALSIPFVGYFVEFIEAHMGLFRILLGILVIDFILSFFHISEKR